MQGIDGFSLVVNKFRSHLEPQHENITCVNFYCFTVHFNSLYLK